MKLASRLLGLFLVAVVIVFGFAASGHGQQAQHYVLDGFGGVHAGGGAPAVSGTPYFGFDIARDLAYAPGMSADGVLVLDGFGGVHATGLGTVAPATPYFGFDIARAIAYRSIPPRLASQALAQNNTQITSSTYTDVASVTIDAPDDGSVLVICNFSLFCSGCTAIDPAAAYVAIGVDNLTAASDIWRQIWYNTPEGHSETWTQTVPVSAGTHTIICLGANGGLTRNLTYFDPTISALFVDHDSTGASRPEVALPTVAGARGR